MYQSGKGYKVISKALGLQRTPVRAVIHKWRKLWNVVNLPRSGRKRKRLGKNGIHGRVPRQKPLLTKKNTTAHLIFAKKYLNYPQDFWANILWTDETKAELFGRCVSRYIWRKTNTVFYNRTSYQQSNMVVVVWWSGDAIKLMEPFILHCIRKSWRRISGCQFVTSSSSALGHAAGQWSQTHQQVHLNGSRKTKLRFWSGQVNVLT